MRSVARGESPAPAGDMSSCPPATIRHEQRHHPRNGRHTCPESSSSRRGRPGSSASRSSRPTVRSLRRAGLRDKRAALGGVASVQKLAGGAKVVDTTCRCGSAARSPPRSGPPRNRPRGSPRQESPRQEEVTADEDGSEGETARLAPRSSAAGRLREPVSLPHAAPRYGRPMRVGGWHGEEASRPRQSTSIGRRWSTPDSRRSRG